MNVLSLFDGISCGKVALDRVGININKYFSSEICKNAIKCSEQNHPNIIKLGDITNWKNWDLPKIDLIIGGSPCQDFSQAKAILSVKNGLGGDKSKLFYQYLEILRTIKCYNPNIKFLLENVKMSKNSEKQLNNYLGVDGVHINSKLLSYQNRPRIYWTNIGKIDQPYDKNISFQDYIDTDINYCKKFKVNNTPSRKKMWGDGVGRGNLKSCKNVTNADKINCLTLKQDRSPNSGLIEFDNFCRYLTTNELEQAQNLPKGYTSMLSKNQSEKVLGNGWTVDVIAHIFKDLKKVK